MLFSCVWGWDLWEGKTARFKCPLYIYKEHSGVETVLLILQTGQSRHLQDKKWSLRTSAQVMASLIPL